MDGLLETGKARGLHAMGLNEHTDIEQREAHVCLSFCLMTLPPPIRRQNKIDHMREMSDSPLSLIL